MPQRSRCQRVRETCLSCCEFKNDALKFPVRERSVYCFARETTGVLYARLKTLARGFFDFFQLCNDGEVFVDVHISLENFSNCVSLAAVFMTGGATASLSLLNDPIQNRKGVTR